MTTSEPAPRGGSRLWPTPNASGNRKSRRAMTPSTNGGRRSGGGQSSPPGLEQAVQLSMGIIPRELWPTPRTTGLDGGSNGRKSAKARGMWPTSQAAPPPPEDDPQLTLFAADSLASLSPSPGRGKSRRIAGGSGPRSVTSFAIYDPATSSWKTLHQDSLLPHESKTVRVGSSVIVVRPSKSSWETWPRSGMTVSGTAYRRASSVPPIYATASGLWPTPVHKPGGGSVLDGGSNSRKAAKARQMWPTPRNCSAMAATVNPDAKFPNLETVVAQREMWPTPKGSAANYGRPRDNDRGDLRAAVMTWPTPNARDWKGAPGQGCQENGGHQSSLPRAVKDAQVAFPTPTANRWDGGLQSHGVNVVSGQLNPEWVEVLMGYPRGWTDLGNTESPASLEVSPDGWTDCED